MPRSLRAVVVALTALAIVSTTAAGATNEGQRVAVPRFVEEARKAGLKHAYEGGWEFFVGGGVAVFDCDEDGRPDLYLAGGTAPAALFANRSRPGRALRFERIVHEATDLTEVSGAYPIDIDSDGLTDLAVLRNGEDVLLRGLGDCAFERANEAWGFDGGDAWTTAFSATWEDGQTWPTLAFGTYVDGINDQGLAQCGDGSLIRPAASGSGFAPALPLEPGHCALSMLFSDWDHSGRRDLRVSNDRHYYYTEGEEQLWRVAPGEPPSLYTREDGWQPVQLYGMGIASQDLTDDGIPEVYLTSIGSNRLETLTGGESAPTDEPAPTFEDIAHARGVSATTPSIGRPIHPSTSWHPEFDDVNNDGRMDLYVSKGNVDEVPDNAMEDPNELYLGRADGTFRQVAKAAGILDPGRTRGAALVDLNSDGLLDLVEVNRIENVSLRRNVGRGKAGKPRPMGHWLEVKLEQAAPNVDAIGAWIELEAGEQRAIREVTIGGGHASGQLGPIHFGLGGEEEAQVRVTWPDGTQGEWQTLAADQIVTLAREAAPQPTEG